MRPFAEGERPGFSPRPNVTTIVVQPGQVLQIVVADASGTVPGVQVENILRGPSPRPDSPSRSPDSPSRSPDSPSRSPDFAFSRF